MQRKRTTHEILREQEAGVPTADACRRHGVSSATFYKWKARFGGLEAGIATFHAWIEAALADPSPAP